MDKDCDSYDLGDIYCVCAISACPSGPGPIGMDIVCGTGEAQVVDYSGENPCKYGDPCGPQPWTSLHSEGVRCCANLR